MNATAMTTQLNRLILGLMLTVGFLAAGLFLPSPALAKFMSGELDLTFGYGTGKITTLIDNWSNARSVAVLANGKIIVAGEDSDKIAIARYNSDGSLDTSFGNGGKVITSVGDFNSAYDIAIQPDGKIVVAGSACVFGGICDMAVVRYEANGSLDNSFDGDGKLMIHLDDHSFANNLVIQPDGKIVIAGGSGLANSGNYSFAIVRLNSNGSLDTSFDGDGKVITSLGSYSDKGASGLALQQDGKIIAAGESGSSYNSTDFALVRYNTDGSLDTSFDGDGKVFTAVSTFHDGALGVAIQPDGRIVAVGGAPNAAIVVRYTTDGSLDSSFGGSGIAAIDIGAYDSFSSVDIQSNGKIVAGGNSGEFVLARLNPNGSLDSSFGGDGVVSTNFDNVSYPNGYGGVNGVAVQPDGNIVGVGFYGLDGEFSFFAVARYIGDAVVTKPTSFDFDGDGRADISVFRPSDGTWYLNQSTAGFEATRFGLSSDIVTPADYDGDGRADISVFREGVWYRINSSNGSLGVMQFGTAGDIPQPADFDGDGRAELAVYRAGSWFTINLANNQVNAVQFGLATDKPVVADYDGDGRADYAVYRDGTWYLLTSTEGFASIQFGLSTDKLVPADYDGDGKTDQAVYRDGTWYVLGSQAGFSTFQFGLASDNPAPADYDGDGRTDAAVYRDGVWHLRQSTAGTTSVQFGQANDLPVPSAYVR